MRKFDFVSCQSTSVTDGEFRLLDCRGISIYVSPYMIIRGHFSGGTQLFPGIADCGLQSVFEKNVC